MCDGSLVFTNSGATASDCPRKYPGEIDTVSNHDRTDILIRRRNKNIITVETSSVDVAEGVVSLVAVVVELSRQRENYLLRENKSVELYLVVVGFSGVTGDVVVAAAVDCIS